MMNTPNGNQDSSNILHFIKEDSIGAEIGVWEGYTSEKILSKKPKMVYLVDPWSTVGYDEPINNKDTTFSADRYYNNPAYKGMAGGADPDSFNNYYDKVYARVVNKFKNLDNVEICRTLSTEWFESFEGEKLDWIYIDGDHSYTGVMNDLLGSLKVVKEGGIILGDDYKWDADTDKGGVKKAVNEFIEKFNFKLQRHGKYQFRVLT